jgi:type IV secretion system protein TrbL
MEVLTPLLKLFTFNFVGGAGRVTADAVWLLAVFFGGELTLIGITFCLRREIDWPALAWKAITAGVFLGLITNWMNFAKLLVKGFIGAGLLIGGEAISETDFTDPDNIALYGLSVTAVIFAQLAKYAGLESIKMLPVIFLSGLTAWAVVALYFGMACWVFVSLVEFYLCSAASVILLPWGMFSKTAWLAEKAIAYVFASGVRLLVLAVILGSALPMLYGQAPGPMSAQEYLVGLATALRLFLAALVLLALCWRANSIAQGLIHGGPQLTLTDATRAMQSMASHVTRLGTAVQALADLAARSDPTPRPPPSSTTSRRRI